MTSSQRLLAADIGGTNSRFAEFSLGNRSHLNLVASYHCLTQDKSIRSFPDLLDKFLTERDKVFSPIERIAAITLAVPGPTTGSRCMPPNIDWDMNLQELPRWHATELINDFAAQAYFFAKNEFKQDLFCIREGKESKHERGHRSAVVGAGTGLGHALLIEERDNKPLVIPSEAGYNTFTFMDAEEREYESFLKTQLEIDYIVNDKVVSGPGIERLHQFLYQQKKTAKQILDEGPKLTLNWFSRFYARACRNYCLAQAVDSRLIISGGLAAKHTDMINNDIFIDEFCFGASETYRKWLRDISIVLNRDENIGLKGAAYHAALKLFD